MAKKIRIYLDTSVISYLYQEDSPAEMEITRKVWEILKRDDYKIYISPLVKTEIERCDKEKKINMINAIESLQYSLLKETTSSEKIKEQLLLFQVLSPRSSDDCSHISLAIVNNCDYILSWNFRHFVNPRTIKGVKALSILNDIPEIKILSPRSFLALYEDGVLV